MIKIAPKGETVRGLDVSHYDEKIDFAQVKAAGFEFCYAKCTEGLSYLDRTYAINKAKAKAAGLLFGAYHFFRPGSSAKDQAAHFLLHADIQKGDLQPMFDWEVKANLNTDPKNAKIFLDTVEAAIGKKMIIYGGPYHLDDYRLGSQFAEYPLWVAHYGTKMPQVPSPWKFWSFWQYSDKGSVAGIPAANEDMDLFNGSLDQLKKFTI